MTSATAVELWTIKRVRQHLSAHFNIYLISKGQFDNKNKTNGLKNQPQVLKQLRPPPERVGLPHADIPAWVHRAASQCRDTPQFIYVPEVMITYALITLIFSSVIIFEVWIIDELLNYLKVSVPIGADDALKNMAWKLTIRFV